MMPIPRIAACAALALALASCAGPQAATDAPAAIPPGYIPAGEVPDSTRVLRPPPQPGSAAQAFDEAVHDAAQLLRGSPRWELATHDASMRTEDRLSIYSCTLGVDISTGNTPRLATLLLRSMSDTGRSTGAAKSLYQRTRPYAAHGESTCVPGAEAMLRTNGSYPSGHTAVGWGAALVLSEVAPERANEILMRGRAYAENRIVCNYHWQSDVIAGRDAAAATVARMRAEPQYQRDVVAARRELATVRARGMAPPRNCPAEQAALAVVLPGTL